MTSTQELPPSKLVAPKQISQLLGNDKENAINVNVPTKRKLTEEDMKENLKQRKLNNSILAAKKLNTSTVSRNLTTRSTTLNKTSSSSSLNRSVLSMSRRPTTTTSRPTTFSSSTTTRRPTTINVNPPQAKPLSSDIERRLEQMERLTSLLQSELEKNNNSVACLTVQLQEKDIQLHSVSELKASIQSDFESNHQELQQAYMDKLQLQNQMVEIQEQHNRKVQDMLLKYQSLESTHEGTLAKLKISQVENDSLRITIATQQGQLTSLQAEVEALKTSLLQSNNLCVEKQKTITDLQIQLDQKLETIKELEAKIREDEGLRRKLHNTIQELKGNIRVFCRIRPYIGSEGTEFEGNPTDLPSHFEFQPNNDRSMDISTSRLTYLGKVDTAKKMNFVFDKFFKPNSTQKEVFEEISQLVQSALDGYNVCIFAYGQTGSGKTFTMEGPGIDSELNNIIVDNEKRGMIPRAVEQIFETSEQLKEKGWNYEMQISYLEIYMEDIRDLFASKIKEDVKYEVKHDNKGNTSVTNLTLVKVRNPSQVYEYLQRASHNRAVAKTNMNERSSRSHSVFQLRISGVNNDTGEKSNGLLNLIDLAGSERIDQSGSSSGVRLKETQNINKSLSCLGDVIAALANKNSHIPYRNSTLTYLLQNSLGGNSKTLMFVNISPRPTDLNETLSSLRFATKVNACEIGTARKQNKVENLI